MTQSNDIAKRRLVREFTFNREELDEETGKVLVRLNRVINEGHFRVFVNENSLIEIETLDGVPV